MGIGGRGGIPGTWKDEEEACGCEDKSHRGGDSVKDEYKASII